MLEKLWAHWQLVRAWNSRINLTSIRSDEDAAWLHFRDSLEAAPHLGQGPVVDMGSGGGFPGIPLAIALPHISFTLVEPRRKRVSFLRAVVGRLNLANVDVIMGRSTDLPPQRFLSLVTRATFSGENQLEECLTWLAPGGKIIAFRGQDSARLAGSSRSIPYHLGDYSRRFDIIDVLSK